MVAVTDRKHYIDWLRLVAVFLLFFYHSACGFHPWGNYYVKNDPLSPVITYIFVWAVDHWHISLFFLLAGASSYYTLHKRTGAEYATERLRRLFIPFVFRALVLVPPISHLGLLSHSDYT